MTTFTPSAELQTAFDKAKIGLMMTKNSVFLSTILFSLKFSWKPDIPTACVTGNLQLWVNPDFFMGLDKEERIFLLAHESWHIALMHLTRIGTRDMETYNRAGDYVINLLLHRAGYTMPKGVLLNTDYQGLTTEEVYDKIKKQGESQGNKNKGSMLDLQPTAGQGDGTPSPPGAGSNPASMTQEQIQQLESQITDVLVKASTRSRMMGDAPGTIPGDVEVMLDKLLNPVLPWNILLQKFLFDRVKTDYSYRRPNRRYFPDWILPSLDSEGLVTIASAVDTSGSVTDDQFAAFISEMTYIKQVLQPEVMHVIDFDTKIKQVRSLNAGDTPTSLTFHGRGGTKIGPVLEWAKEHQPKVLVIFTDGEFSFPPESDPGCPILWVIHSNSKFEPPFGEVIFYPMEKAA